MVLVMSQRTAISLVVSSSHNGFPVGFMDGFRNGFPEGIALLAGRGAGPTLVMHKGERILPAGFCCLTVPDEVSLMYRFSLDVPDFFFFAF